jgi:hypothetical protein
MLATADLGTERVEQLTRELVGSLSQWDGNNFFGPDSSYQSFIARPGDGGVRVATWHELAERDPRLVCLDGGFRSVPPGTRDEVLAREASPSWLEFREAWSSMRARIDELIRTAPDRQPAAFPPERVQWAWK